MEWGGSEVVDVLVCEKKNFALVSRLVKKFLP